MLHQISSPSQLPYNPRTLPYHAHFPKICPLSTSIPQQSDDGSASVQKKIWKLGLFFAWKQMAFRLLGIKELDWSCIPACGMHLKWKKGGVEFQPKYQKQRLNSWKWRSTEDDFRVQRADLFAGYMVICRGSNPWNPGWIESVIRLDPTNIRSRGEPDFFPWFPWFPYAS